MAEALNILRTSAHFTQFAGREQQGTQGGQQPFFTPIGLPPAQKFSGGKGLLQREATQQVVRHTRKEVQNVRLPIVSQSFNGAGQLHSGEDSAANAKASAGRHLTFCM